MKVAKYALEFDMTWHLRKPSGRFPDLNGRGNSAVDGAGANHQRHLADNNHNSHLYCNMPKTHVELASSKWVPLPQKYRLHFRSNQRYLRYSQ